MESYTISLNYSFYSGKYIYLGETSHTFHPVGGQGLNLCWRDVDALTSIFSLSLFKNNKLLIPFIYSISRLFDVLTIALLTDFLVRYSRSNSNLFFYPRTLIIFILNLYPLPKGSPNSINNCRVNQIGLFQFFCFSIYLLFRTT